MNEVLEKKYPAIKPGITRKDIARIEATDLKVIRRRMRSIGINHSNTLSPKEVALYRQHYIDI